RHRALVRTARGPLLDDEVFPDVLTTALEAQVGEDREDAAKRHADLLPADVDVAGHVVLENRVLRMHGNDRVDVVRVPRIVVAVDEVLQVGAVHAVTYLERS